MEKLIKSVQTLIWQLIHQKMSLNSENTGQAGAQGKQGKEQQKAIGNGPEMSDTQK